MEKTLRVIPKETGFSIQVNFADKSRIYTTESVEVFKNKEKANLVAREWSRMYGAKLEL